MNRKKFRKSVALILGVLMVLAGSMSVYADTYHDFRDGDINLYLPDSWAVEEIDVKESEDMIFEEILYAYDETGGSSLNLGLYYVAEKVQNEDYIYFDGYEQDAMAYYEDYGKNALEQVYGDLEGVSQLTLSDPVFYEGEWNSFLVVNASGVIEEDGENPYAFKDVLYLTAGMTNDDSTVVHSVLMFYIEDGSPFTDEKLTAIQGIADEYYDYGYNDAMAGSADDSFWESDESFGADSSGEDIGLIIVGMIAIFLPIIIVIVAVIIVVKRIKRKKRELAGAAPAAFHKVAEELKEVQQVLDVEDLKSKFKKKKKERNSFSAAERHAEQKAERRTERRIERKSTMQMRNMAASDAERRYMESLQTLRKTGLLTKDEMRDMLERHQRSIERQRRRR